MRKTILCLMSMMLLTVCTACGPAQTDPLPATEPAQTQTETGTAAVTDIPAETPQPDVAVPESIDIELYRSGVTREGYSAETDEQKEIVMDAVFNYMLKSAAWPALDIDSMDMYIHIAERYANGDESEYYVFDKDGRHCMQNGRCGMYSAINDEVYEPLYELAMGWHTPHTMTIVSGGKSIHAVRNWVWSKSADGLLADGVRLTPREAADEVEYVTLAEDFAPYIDGEMQPGLIFKLYNEDYEEAEYPIPSGLAAWTYIGHAGPGKYIAVAECGFEDEDGSSGYQYYFGLAVPEREAD